MANSFLNTPAIKKEYYFFSSQEFAQNSLPPQNLEHVCLPLWFATAFATASPLRLPLPAGRVPLPGALAPRGRYLAPRGCYDATAERSGANSQPTAAPRAPHTPPELPMARGRAVVALPEGNGGV